MFEKEYTKNLTKLKNRLQVQSNRPNFLQDQNWTSSQKSQPQSRKSYKPKYENKNSKVFDLDQIKRQLGFIELKNSPLQQTQNSNRIEKVILSQAPSFKKQKQVVKENSQKKFTHKSSKIMIKQESAVNENGGFTQRINQLVKLRVQHETIINSLVKKKPSNISTQEDNLPISMMKNQSHSSGYIKVTNQYEVYSPQKSQNESRRFQKPKNPPPKLELDTATFNYQKNIKKNSTFQQQPESKVKQPQKVEMKDQNEKNYKRTFTEKQILKNKKQQSQQRPSTFTQPRIQLKNHSRQVSRIQQPISQDIQQMQQSNELNESKFQMQHHVNLLASLSQFQYTNRSKNQKQVSLSHQQNQFYQSLFNFIQSSISNNNKFSSIFSNKKPQIRIIYAGIDENYQSYQLLTKGFRRVKQVNKQFQKVVQYLTQNQIWQGLFRSEQKSIPHEKSRALIKSNEYHGLCFDSGNYIQVQLSQKEISPSEKKLLMFNFQEQSVINCDISLVLLTRLINLDINKNFSQMLNCLFGYQFKTSDIEKLSDFMDCMDFIDRLRDIHNKQLRNKGGLIVENNEDGSFKQRYSLSHIQEQEQNGQMQNPSILQDVEKHCDFQLYGQNKTSQIFELITPYFFSQKNKTVQTIQLYEFRELMRHEKYTKRLSQNYCKLSIINKKELPVKSIQLKHYLNHFVVVSINVMQEGLYFISVGQKVEESLKKENYKNPIKYRLCLISSNTKTILECLILQRNQSYPVYLPKQQFEVYISAYESQTESADFYQKNNKSQRHITNQQFLNFTFYIQSHHIIARSTQKMSKRELQLELRLKEEYQSYTSMIVEQFIEFSFLEKEITKFFSQIHQLNQNQISDDTKLKSNTLNTFGQRNSKNKLQNPQKQQRKISLQNSDIKSQQSLNFVNNQPNKIQNYLSSESRFLRLSMDNQNAFQIQQWKDNQESPVKSQENQKQFFTFQDLQIESSSRFINILRVHLKALDLFIDCIDTTQILDKESIEKQNSTQLKIKYSQSRVLCDQNHHKNITDLRPDSINLIYLTKDSSIKSIKIQNKAGKNIKNKHNQSQNEINFRMFRKEW